MRGCTGGAQEPRQWGSWSSPQPFCAVDRGSLHLLTKAKGTARTGWARSPQWAVLPSATGVCRLIDLPFKTFNSHNGPDTFILTKTSPQILSTKGTNWLSPIFSTKYIWSWRLKMDSSTLKSKKGVTISKCQYNNYPQPFSLVYEEGF